MSKAGRGTREERRRAELDQRRARRRGQQTQGPSRSRLLLLSLGALALGAVAIAVFTLVNAPPGEIELREPAGSSNYEQADGQALGAADAPVTVEIYSDYQCPACGVLANTIKPPLERDYVNTGQVRLVYRDFAFLGPESLDAAVAARCAAQQNRFWPYHDYLFANQGSENRGSYSAQRLEAMAVAVELDMGEYRACIADPTHRQALDQERAAAAALPIDSTPTLVVDGEQRIVGVPDYAALRQVIDARLGQAGLGR